MIRNVKIFSDYSALTLTLDLDTWTKVSFYFIPQGTQALRVRLQPDWVKRKEDMLWTSDLGQAYE